MSKDGEEIISREIALALISREISNAPGLMNGENMQGSQTGYSDCAARCWCGIDEAR